MANGRLAAITPAANTNTLLYTSPAGTASLAITVCNTGTSTTNIRISIENSGAVGLARTNCIEYDTAISANSVLERGGIILANGQNLYCRSSLTNVNFIVYGYES
jgi:hypothetical protein